VVLTSHEIFKVCHYLPYEKEYTNIWKNPSFPLSTKADPWYITEYKKDLFVAKFILHEITEWVLFLTYVLNKVKTSLQVKSGKYVISQKYCLLEKGLLL
jgi:hypothetical protein